MRAIITAGGTGGHIYPALAIYEKIMEKEPKSKILYIGTTDRMEKDIVPKRNIEYIALKTSGINRKNIFKTIKSLYYFINAVNESKKIIKDFKPEIVIGVGGYISAPVIYAAKKLNIKTVIHEQNSVFGLSNKMLLKYSNIIFTSLPNTIEKANKYRNKVVFSGNPCSEMALKKEIRKKEELGFDRSKKLIMIVMGSLGSMVVNQKLKEILPNFKNKNYEILFITGKDYYEEYKDINIKNVKIFPYIEDMVRILKDVDLLISRAGATTISEIIALSVPSILIPSPYVTENHQYKNAMDLVNKDAAILVEEKDLNNLIECVDNLIYDENKLNNIKDNLSKLKINDSASIIYNNIKKLIGE